MKAKGDIYEALACEYLQQAGLKRLEQHFRFKHWEIDLIMQDGSILVFVEVKYRSGSHYGGSSYALAAAQIKRLRQAALAYLQQHQLKEQHTQCRFDLVAINGTPPALTIEWLKNAF